MATVSIQTCTQHNLPRTPPPYNTSAALSDDPFDPFLK